MNRLTRIVWTGVLIVLVVIPLGLLGTCSVMFGVVSLTQGLGGFLAGLLLIGLGIGGYWLANKVKSRAERPTDTDGSGRGADC